MHICRMVSVLLTLLCARTAVCQSTGFTGTWQQVGLTDQTRVEKIEVRDSLVVVSYDARAAMSSASGTIEYRTDGSEIYQNTAAWKKWTTASWQGPTLVISTIRLQNGRVTATREIWTLSAESTLTKARRTVSEHGVREE